MWSRETSIVIKIHSKLYNEWSERTDGKSLKESVVLIIDVRVSKPYNRF